MDFLGDAQVEVSFYDQIGGGGGSVAATPLRNFDSSPAQRLLIPSSERFSSPLPLPLRRRGSSDSIASTAASSVSHTVSHAEGTSSSSEWSSDDDEAVFLGPKTDKERSYVDRLNRALSQSTTTEREASRRQQTAADGENTMSKPKKGGVWQTPGGSRIGTHPLKKRDSCEFHRRRTLVFSKRDVNVSEADGSTSRRRTSGWQGGFYEKTGSGGGPPSLRVEATAAASPISKDDGPSRRDSGTVSSSSSASSSSRNRDRRIDTADPFIATSSSTSMSSPPPPPPPHVSWRRELQPMEAIGGGAMYEFSDQLLTDQVTQTDDDADGSALNVPSSPIGGAATTTNERMLLGAASQTATTYGSPIVPPEVTRNNAAAANDPDASPSRTCQRALALESITTLPFEKGSSRRFSSRSATSRPVDPAAESQPASAPSTISDLSVIVDGQDGENAAAQGLGAPLSSPPTYEQANVQTTEEQSTPAVSAVDVETPQPHAEVQPVIDDEEPPSGRILSPGPRSVVLTEDAPDVTGPVKPSSATILSEVESPDKSATSIALEPSQSSNATESHPVRSPVALPTTPDLLPTGTPSALRPTALATPLVLAAPPPAPAPADLSFDPDSPLPIQRGRRSSLRLASSPMHTPFDENRASVDLGASPIGKILTIEAEEVAAPATPVLQRSPLKATTPGRLNALGESMTANMITPQRSATPRLPPASSFSSTALKSPLALRPWDPMASVKKSRAMEEKTTARQAAISSQLSAIAASSLSVSRMGFLPAPTPRRTPMQKSQQQQQAMIAPQSRPAAKMLGGPHVGPIRSNGVKTEKENKEHPDTSMPVPIPPSTPSTAIVQIPVAVPASEPPNQPAPAPAAAPALSASTSSISGPAPRLNVREFLAAKKSGIPHVRRAPSASSTSSATSASSLTSRAPASSMSFAASPAKRLAPPSITGARPFVSRTATAAQRPTAPSRPISRLRQALKASQQAQPRVASRPSEVPTAKAIEPKLEAKPPVAASQVAALIETAAIAQEPVVDAPPAPPQAPLPASPPPAAAIPIERPRRAQTIVRTTHPQVRQYVPKATAAALAARNTSSQSSSKPARQLTETELKNLTSFHTARNEVYFCSIARNVHKREGPRPPSPNKVRTIAEREEQERKLSRERRAKKRDSRKSSGETDADEWDSTGSDAEKDEVILTKHVRGPGDDEDYVTPARPGKARKSAKPSEATRVRWDKGLVVRSDGPRAGELPRAKKPLKSCLRHQVSFASSRAKRIARHETFSNSAFVLIMFLCRGRSNSTTSATSPTHNKPSPASNGYESSSMCRIMTERMCLQRWLGLRRLRWQRNRVGGRPRAKESLSG